MEASVTSSGEFPVCDSFDDMGLPDNLLRGIYSYGFERPSAFQQCVIGPIVQGRNTVGQSVSGTGKTAAMLIGSLACIDVNLPACQVLVLAPFRELAMSTRALARTLGEYLQVRSHVCIGGTSVRDDVERLRQGQHAVFGTPGRVFDMLRRRHLAVEHLKVLFLDEADEILARGFNEQVLDIVRIVPPEVQVCCFFSTLSPDLGAFVDRCLQNPVRVLGRGVRPSVAGIRQYYMVVDDEDSKLEVLTNLSKRLINAKTVIYCNSQPKADALAQALLAHDFTVSMVHPGLDRAERQLATRDFDSGSSQVLISTALLVRGVDVESVPLTINYDLPQQAEDYARRVGRSGRLGGLGVAVNFVTPQTVQAVHDIEQHCCTQMEELTAHLPTDNPGPHRAVRWRSLGCLSQRRAQQ